VRPPAGQPDGKAFDPAGFGYNADYFTHLPLHDVFALNA
jgi:hypothetical protein